MMYLKREKNQYVDGVIQHLLKEGVSKEDVKFLDAYGRYEKHYNLEADLTIAEEQEIKNRCMKDFWYFAEYVVKVNGAPLVLSIKDAVVGYILKQCNYVSIVCEGDTIIDHIYALWLQIFYNHNSVYETYIYLDKYRKELSVTVPEFLIMVNTNRVIHVHEMSSTTSYCKAGRGATHNIDIFRMNNSDNLESVLETSLLSFGNICDTKSGDYHRVYTCMEVDKLKEKFAMTKFKLRFFNSYGYSKKEIFYVPNKL